MLHVQQVPGGFRGGACLPEGSWNPQGTCTALEAQRVQQGPPQVVCRQMQEEGQIPQHCAGLLQQPSQGVSANQDPRDLKSLKKI